MHPYPKKLLVLIPAWFTANTPAECKHILSRFLSLQDFEVVLLSGTGADPRTDEDAARVRSALTKLGAV
jgi:hypothetical protein